MINTKVKFYRVRVTLALLEVGFQVSIRSISTGTPTIYWDIKHKTIRNKVDCSNQKNNYEQKVAKRKDGKTHYYLCSIANVPLVIYSF